MELSEAVVKVLRESAAALTGHDRRLFMARAVRDLFDGVVNRAVRTLDWDERTVRLGRHELRTGIECLDGRTAAGRPRAEVRVPSLVDDLRAIVDGQSQIDPRFHSQRLYTRLTAAEVRRQLVVQKHYLETALPSAETIRVKLDEQGYHLRRVAKVLPKKRSRKPRPSSIR